MTLIPAFVSKSESHSTGGGGDLTVSAALPPALATGNGLLMAVILYYGSTPPPNPVVSTGPAWTILYTSGQWGFGARMRMRVFWRRIDGTELDPFVITNDAAASTVMYAVGIAQYTNVAPPTGSPLDGAPVAGPASIDLTAVAPAYTTSQPKSMLICFGTGGESTPYVLSFPGNVQRFNAINPLVANQVTMCELPMVTPGTVAAGTWSRVSGNQGWMGHALALLGGAALSFGQVATQLAASVATAGYVSTKGEPNPVELDVEVTSGGSDVNLRTHVVFGYDGAGRAVATISGASGGETYRFWISAGTSTDVVGTVSPGAGSIALEIDDLRGLAIGDLALLCVQQVSGSPPLLDFPNVGLAMIRFGTRGGAPPYAATWGYNGAKAVTVNFVGEVA